ncbi:MAG: bifunctional glutamate N-acetyltransferase/amino-acid acetyltransferase ArgJ [Phaeodactylibacter sp.]|nr:bifunctional glutamate N-acetyltransferase/amino-acid acetyltransferase ArgJ [Phaeodactylibacter sp.]MCB9272890.1 bifunctional glutamate N-acetyltransferase/amino-acid acetyltransferase ArgJ [Lewinellaceae bacterium]
MIKNLTSVRGIKCWGAHIGIKSMRRDLAIIYSEVPASAACTFTQNKVAAEPVKISRRHVRDGKAQVIVCNAGNANACTGEQGRLGAEAMVAATAEALGIDKELVLVASTGIIGEPFPTDDVVDGIRLNVGKLSDDPKAGSFAANAILTTDTFAKEGFLEFELEGSPIYIGGIAKGSGMIHPNMATMLSFIVSDIAIGPGLLKRAVTECVNASFNMITVDGDTSTNDMVAVLCNGLAGNKLIESETDDGYVLFRQKLEDMMAHLAKLIVSDGEGSSKFVEYRVSHAPSEEIARKLVRAISGSALVKTAMFGRDPNWGRIICAGGNAGVPFDYTHVDLYLGTEEEQVQVLKKGSPTGFDRNSVKRLLRESHLLVHLDMNEGDAESVGWGTDLTTDYVMFNSVYTT